MTCSVIDTSEIYSYTFLHRKVYLYTFPHGKFTSIVPRSGELRTQKLKFHLLRTQSLKVLSLKPGVGQYIAIHATLTARDFFLCQFLPFRFIHLHFFQNLSRVFPVLAAANTGSCVGPQNKISQPAGCRFPY